MAYHHQEFRAHARENKPGGLPVPGGVPRARRKTLRGRNGEVTPLPREVPARYPGRDALTYPHARWGVYYLRPCVHATEARTGTCATRTTFLMGSRNGRGEGEALPVGEHGVDQHALRLATDVGRGRHCQRKHGSRFFVECVPRNGWGDAGGGRHCQFPRSSRHLRAGRPRNGCGEREAVPVGADGWHPVWFGYSQRMWGGGGVVSCSGRVRPARNRCGKGETWPGHRRTRTSPELWSRSRK